MKKQNLLPLVKQKEIIRFLPGGKLINNLLNALNLELEGNGQDSLAL